MKLQATITVSPFNLEKDLLSIHYTVGVFGTRLRSSALPRPLLGRRDIRLGGRGLGHEVQTCSPVLCGLSAAESASLRCRRSRGAGRSDPDNALRNQHACIGTSFRASPGCSTCKPVFVSFVKTTSMLVVSGRSTISGQAQLILLSIGLSLVQVCRICILGARMYRKIMSCAILGVMPGLFI